MLLNGIYRISLDIVQENGRQECNMFEIVHAKINCLSTVTVSPGVSYFIINILFNTGEKYQDVQN